MTELFGLDGDELLAPGQGNAGSAAVPSTSATLPAVAARAMLLVASGVGSATPQGTVPDVHPLLDAP